MVASYKDPSFQDRVASAAKAKQKALDQLRAKPPVDPAVMAERREAWQAQEQVRSAERAAKATVRVEKALAKAAEEAEVKAAATLKAARLTPATAAEMKSARDARYAARQARRK